MTQLTERPTDQSPQRDVPPHPHYTLGTLVTIGVIGTLVAVGLAIAALMITASRDSVDDAIVSERVDEMLAGVAVPTAAGGNVIPDFVPRAELPVAPATEVNVAVAPEMPPAIARSTPAIVEVELEVVEGVTAIDPGSGVEFETWGFKVAGSDGVVSGTPGPVIRTRVGDVIRLTVTNPAGNSNPHNIDLHAVTGPHGGGEATTVAPGESRTIEARMLYPGFFMYHCAYGDVPAHIAHGMYGGILVEPETPLPSVEHEWYMVQSEYYTTGTEGTVALDRQAVTDEDPTYVVFNGAVGAIAGDNALQMAVGETGRIYFVNAGLNLVSNFHPIGSHWDTVYPEAALLSEPIRGSQTTLVPAGGGTVVELIGQAPSTIVLVDHALSRAFDKGAVGHIVISGEEQPEIFEETTTGPVSETPPEHTDHDEGTTAAAGESVAILAGSWEVQDMDAPDEFAETESPADYSVNVLTIPFGTTVTWTNEDPGMMHTVSSVDGLFESGFLNEGDTWSYTFDEPGEFEYFCQPHPWMRAKVVVEG